VKDAGTYIRYHLLDKGLSETQLRAVRAMVDEILEDAEEEKNAAVETAWHESQEMSY